MKNCCPIFLASKTHSSLVAFKEGGREIRFSEADLLVGGVAKKLSGMELGQRVSVVSSNSIEMIILIFALQRLGVSVVLHNTRLRAEDWKAQAELAGVQTTFVAEEFKSNVDFGEVLDIPPLEYESLEEKANFSPEVNLEKEGIIMFTSGSTGVGKGVRLSLSNFISNAEASNLVNDLNQGDTWLATLPFFHVGGFCIVFRTILAGACSLIADAKNTFSFLDKCTHVSLVPSVLAEVIDKEGGFKKLANLKNILLGGAPSDSQLLEKIKELPVRTSYGMTETCSHICMLHKAESHLAQNLKTSGNLLKGVEVKISEDGEICLKGPSIFLGYLGQEDRIKDQWFATGDLGKIDSQGRLVVEGRKDRTIISGGENINPKQIEDLALTCEGVKEAAVIGVDDPKWGKRPVIYIVSDRNFNLISLQKLFDQELPKFKIPDDILNIESMPKTAIGKIDYNQLLSKGFLSKK